jgi:Putative Ig domain
VASKITVTRKRLTAVAGIMVVGALAASTTVAAAGADAAANPLQVKLVACGTGSSAVWNSDLNPVLTAGTASAGQCGAPAGSTYNPAYADVRFTAVGGGVVPTTEPVFKASAYSSGTPRMEIDLNNGKTLVGYPGLALSGQTAPDAAGMAWAVGNSGTTYTDYTTAYNAVTAYSTTVKDAYIVEDASQPVGTANTLTAVQYDGKTLGAGIVLVQPVAPQTVTVGTATPVLQISAQTTSSDTAGLTIAVTGLPDGLSFNATNNTVTGTPAADAASGAATVTARDAYGQTGTTTIGYTVQPKPVPVPVLSHGKGIATAPTREIVTWQQTVPSWEKFVIVGPGPINGHVGWVPPGIQIGYYSGLSAHHGYTVTFTPYTAKGGYPIQGAHPGAVYFVS